MKNIVKTLLLSLVSCLQIFSTLSAGWSPIVTLDSAVAGSNSQYDPSNNLLVSWFDPTTMNVNAAFLSPLGVLSTPIVVGAGAVGTLTTSSVNPATGDAVVLWSINSAILASSYNASTKTWAPAQTLDSDVNVTQENFVSIDPTSGIATAIWTYLDPGTGATYVAAAVLPTINGTWSAPILTTEGYGEGLTLDFYDFALSSNGPFASVYSVYEDGEANFHFQVQTFSALTQSWTTIFDQISANISTGSGGQSSIKVDNSGNTAVMIYVLGESSFIFGWATGDLNLEQISTTDSTAPLLSVDNAGRAYVVWNSPSDNLDALTITHEETYFFGASTQWSVDTTIDTPFANVASISPDATGHLYVAFNNSTNGTVQSIQTSTFTAGATDLIQGSWSPLVTVSDTVSENLVSIHGVDSNPSGDILVSWVVEIPDNLSVQEVHRDAGGTFSPLTNVTSGIDVTEGFVLSFISNADNKAIIFEGTNARELNYTILSVFINNVTPVPPNPARDFVGISLKNRFLTQTSRANILAWLPSTSSTVVGYQLYRNGVLIATIPSNQLTAYEDPNVKKKTTYVYELFAVNADGTFSTPVFVTLTTK